MVIGIIVPRYLIIHIVWYTSSGPQSNIGGCFGLYITQKPLTWLKHQGDTERERERERERESEPS